MTKIYTAAEMRIREQRAVEQGTSLLQLMENAGQAASKDLLARYTEANHFLIICGKGNNGGDGLVMARVLAEQGKNVELVLLLGRHLSDLASTNLERLPSVVSIINVDDVQNSHYDVIIDAVFGTGFDASLSLPIQQFFKGINAQDGTKISLDVPSGLNCDSGIYSEHSFQADLTYAFAAYKPAHLMDDSHFLCGHVLCLDIGID